MKIVESPELHVIGIGARTNNAKEMSAEGIIGPMWDRAVSENMFDKIPNRVDNTVLAMYTDYESDSNGEYTFFIGAKVTTLDVIPEGLLGRTVAAARYSVITSERGPLYEVVPQAWQRIWSMSEAGLGGKRAFVADLEIYDERALNPTDAVMEVWVGVK